MGMEVKNRRRMGGDYFQEGWCITTGGDAGLKGEGAKIKKWGKKKGIVNGGKNKVRSCRALRRAI